MITGIDHILLAVEDVASAAGAYRRLGFEVSAGGEHPRMGTYNALVPFADGSYLELIGVKNRALSEQFPHTRAVLAALARTNKLATFALASDDLEADVAAIRVRGVPLNNPIAGERTRPDGQRVAWRTAHFQEDSLPFLIQDVTPHDLRIPPPTEGIGRSLRLAEVRVACSGAGACAQVLRNILGFEPVRNRFSLPLGAIAAEEGEGKLRLAQIVLAAEHPEQVHAAWQRAGASVETAGDKIAIGPRDTAGAPLAIVSSTS